MAALRNATVLLLACVGCLQAALADDNVPADTTKPMKCYPEKSLDGASFDLTELAKQHESFTVQDRIQTSQSGYAYTFGICQNIAPPANCADEKGDSKKRHATAPAWQTHTATEKNEHCMYLGSPDHESHEWSVDKENPAAGVTLTYKGGEHCSNGARRELALKFKCAPKTVNHIEQLVIDESAHCKYDITIDTEFACPLECGLAATGSVCSSHGLCGYDSDMKSARCYCNIGRSGEHCENVDEDKENDSSYGPMLGLLIFVAVAVVLMIGLLIGLFRYMRTRKVEVMGDVYTALRGGESFELERVDMESLESALPMMPDTNLEDAARQL